MIVADRKLIDDSIRQHGDDWWNNTNNVFPAPNREYIIDYLLAILAEDDLDLKVIRKK